MLAPALVLMLALAPALMPAPAPGALLALTLKVLDLPTLPPMALIPAALTQVVLTTPKTRLA